jgi:hypothetical protein
MVSNTSPLKREASRREWEFLAAVLWTALFIFWMYNISRCLPAYEFDPNQTVRYSELIAAHGRPDTPIYNPLWVFFVFNLGAIGLAVVAKRRWFLLMLLANPAMCVILFMSIICINSTILTHVGSVEFDGHTYHLTRATSGDWDISYDFLRLYDCDFSDELCRGQTIYVDGRRLDTGDMSLAIDPVTNTLKVTYLGSVIFTVEAKGNLSGSADAQSPPAT